jgi:ubiquinone/menaquinone biosynthesis C-methylase UbiE
VIGKTLDVGCGIGDFLSYKSDAIGVDVNKNNVNFCIDRGLDATYMQPDKLPFDSSSFNNVILDNVLEHIEQPRPLLDEIHRVTIKKGHLLIGVPGAKGYLSDDDHKNFYDESYLRQVVENSNFFHKKTFHTPFLSSWLDQNVRQYCIYCLFSK